MIKRLTIILLMLSALSSSAFADITKEDIAGALDRGKLVHPYLYFSEQDKPAMLERIKKDPEQRRILDRYIADAKRLIYLTVEDYPPREAKHPRYWSDGKYDQYVNGYMNNAETLAFVYQMTGEERYAAKAFEFVNVLCDLQTWCYRAHEFPIIYSRVWPWGDKDDQVLFNFDIRTGDMSYEMGAVYDWLYPALNKEQRDRIRGAILEKSILLARGNYNYHWWANAYRCNWNGICFTGLGVASIALLADDPRLVDVVAESYNRMSRMFNEFDIDGGWQEGRSYWAYGMRSCIFFMDSVKRLTGNKYDLFQHPKVKNNPASFALYGITGYFGDGSGGIVGSTHLLNKLADETKNSEAAWYRSKMLGDGSEMFDIIWPRTKVKAVEPKVKSKHFRTIDWVFMRTDFDNENVTVATKAGLNDDPHHGHLDVGHIILNWRGKAYLQDLGSGNYFYDEKYFDEARWTYPQASSVGHNVVFVNGEQQISAKYKDKPWQEGIGGKVLEFRTSKGRDYTLMDATNAYPKKEMNKWRRHIILDKPVVTVMLDEVGSAAGAEIEARFHSDCSFDLKDKFALLKDDKGIMALIPVTDSQFTFRAGKHPYLPVRKDARFQWIPYFGTVLKAPTDMTRLVTIVLPVNDEKEASAITSSAKTSTDSKGNVTLAFSKGGKSFSYKFTNGSDGLVLAR